MLQQVGIFLANALDARQVSAVDPLEDQLAADLALLGQVGAALGGGAGREQFCLVLDASGFQLGCTDRSDAFDLRKFTYP